MKCPANLYWHGEPDDRSQSGFFVVRILPCVALSTTSVRLRSRQIFGIDAFKRHRLGLLLKDSKIVQVIVSGTEA